MFIRYKTRYLGILLKIIKKTPRRHYANGAVLVLPEPSANYIFTIVNFGYGSDVTVMNLPE